MKCSFVLDIFYNIVAIFPFIIIIIIIIIIEFNFSLACIQLQVKTSQYYVTREKPEDRKCRQITLTVLHGKLFYIEKQKQNKKSKKKSNQIKK